MVPYEAVGVGWDMIRHRSELLSATVTERSLAMETFTERSLAVFKGLCAVGGMYATCHGKIHRGREVSR